MRIIRFINPFTFNMLDNYPMKESIRFIGKAKISKQGQVTLPTEARDSLGIPVESDIYWYEVDDFLVAVKDLMSQNDLADKLAKKRRV